jgi:hypothetical protein
MMDSHELKILHSIESHIDTIEHDLVIYNKKDIRRPDFSIVPAGTEWIVIEMLTYVEQAIICNKDLGNNMHPYSHIQEEFYVLKSDPQCPKSLFK